VISAIEYSAEAALVGGDRWTAFSEVEEVFANMDPPRSDSGRLLITAVRCACNYALGQMAAATEHAEVFLTGVRRESFRNVDPLAKQDAIELVGVYGSKAYAQIGVATCSKSRTEWSSLPRSLTPNKSTIWCDYGGALRWRRHHRSARPRYWKICG